MISGAAVEESNVKALVYIAGWGVTKARVPMPSAIKDLHQQARHRCGRMAMA